MMYPYYFTNQTNFTIDNKIETKSIRFFIYIVKGIILILFEIKVTVIC